MKTLIITAHPSSLGHTHIIANTYKEEKLKLGNEVELIDLYSEENQLPFLKFENVREWPVNDVMKKMQEKILWADELVFVHPVWWSFMPAIMKNWFDYVMTAGFAYKYEKTGLKKFLTGKTAKVFATSGGKTWFYTIPFSPFRTHYDKFILGFFGVKLKEIKVCGKMSMPGNEERFEKFLDKVRKSASS